MSRIHNHPIVQRDRGAPFSFTFAGEEVIACPDEVISSALISNGHRVFGHHHRDGSPQGIYCANGQCSQCLVLADGVPVKACMTYPSPGICVEPVDALPKLPPIRHPPSMEPIETLDVPVLILGAGPAGLSAAIELGERGVDVILVDDKDRLGGKLVLQTHRFFGSIDAVYAGTRGIDICARLATRVRELNSVSVWVNSTALAVFSDKLVGILREGRYVLVRPKVLLVATGARERSLVFPGNTLPGVYGAGAFQTLVNRDLVRASERLFIVGGGNVGLIAGYHALQAGITVVGLIEAMPECSGYRVHRDKLARLGVPIHPSHSVFSANGNGQVESVTIAQIDEGFRPVAGTEKSFACDTVLIAVGLDPVDEFARAAKACGLTVYSAGDAEEIAEASAAIFSGKIKGLEIARLLGATTEEIPADWRRIGDLLKSKPGPAIDRAAVDSYLVANQEFRCRETPNGEATSAGGVFPVLHCSQEIPCNPCASVCPQGLIRIADADLRRLPQFVANEMRSSCIGCERCVVVCPGLAITLVDWRPHPESSQTSTRAEQALVTIPFEFERARLNAGDKVTVVSSVGTVLGVAPVFDVRALPQNDRTLLVRVNAPREIAQCIAGVRLQASSASTPLPEGLDPLSDSDIVCLCERVTAGEIRAGIRSGIRDVNEIKAMTRAGMGACGGKTCNALVLRLFREEGVPPGEVTGHVPRPPFVEVPLGVFAGAGASADTEAGPSDSPGPGEGG